MKKSLLSRLAIPLFVPKPSRLRQHQRAGDEARDARRWRVATAEYREVINLRPDLAHIWVQLGHALKEDGHVGDALEAYEEAIRRAPDVADTHLQRGHALKLQGRTEEAAAAYAHCLSIEAGMSAAALELRGLGYSWDGDALRKDDVGSGPLPRLTAPAGGMSKPPVVDGLAAVMARHGLLPHVLPHFDADYYLSWHGVRLQSGEDQRVAALRHFGEVGLAGLLPVNERAGFDPAFYAQLYQDKFQLSDADAYRYWLNFGIPLGRAPNMTVWLQDVTGLAVRSVQQIDLVLYRAALPELQEMPDTTAIEWLINGGLLDGRMPRTLSADGVVFYCAAGSRAHVRQNLSLAIAILQRVLAQVPLHMPTLQLYADRLVDAGQQPQATAVYQQVRDTGLADWRTFLHQAVALQAQQRFHDAHVVLAAGVRAFPQHQVLRTNLADAVLAFWQSAEREYHLLARSGRIAQGQDVILGFCRQVVVPFSDETMPARPVRRVALFAQLDLPQCRFYRVEQKVEHLEAAGFKVTVFDAQTETSAFLGQARRFDAVIFYRVPALPHVIPAILKARELGAVTFYEIDDLLFLPEEYPGPIEGYAGQISRETYFSLAMGVPLFQAALRMCDYALASTPTLAQAMAPLTRSGRAFVHRNAMGAVHERWFGDALCKRGAGAAGGRGPDEPVTIFYGSGTRAHKEDFQLLLEPALIEIARRHKERVVFLLVGWLTVSQEFRAAAGERLVIVEPVFEFDAYWGLLGQADINLAVLKRSRNVDSKSEIKWMEAAMFGIPSVVSRTSTYEEVIEDGQTGFMCDTVADWTGALDRLVRDASLRRRVGSAAQEAVRQGYSVAAMARNMGSILEAVGGVPVSRRRKILVVNVFYAPQLIGGATRVIHDNIDHLSRSHGEAFEFEVFCAIDGAAEDNLVHSYVQDGVLVTGITRGAETETTGDIADAKVAAAFHEHVALSQPDVIHFHCLQRLTLSVVSVAQELGIPYFVTAHDGWWISDRQFLLDEAGHERTYDFAQPRRVLAEQGSKAFTRMQAMRPALAGAVAVLVVSEPFAAVYRRCGVSNVRALPNGVSSLVPLPRTPGPPGRVRLGFVGGLTRHKGFDLLKRVLSREAFTHLEIVLVDRSKPRSHMHEERWGSVPVRVIGEFEQERVSSLYAGIDVLLAPSIWAEAFGLVTREALACGCWVVASDRGAIGADIVEGVNGFVVDVTTDAGLVGILHRIDSDFERFRVPPPPREIRKATEQGDDLAAMYLDIALRPSGGRSGTEHMEQDA